MADSFDAYREQAKTTIGKIMGTRPGAVDTTVSLASNPAVDTLTRSELIGIANELARDFGELEKVPKTFEPQASLRDDVKQLLEYIGFFSGEIDALFTRTQHWDQGVSIDELPATYAHTKEVAARILQVLRHGGFKDVPKKTKSEFIAKREIFYELIGEKLFKDEFILRPVTEANAIFTETVRIFRSDVTQLPPNITDQLAHYLAQLEQSIDVCKRYLDINSTLKELLEFEPSSQTERSFTARADRINRTLAGANYRASQIEGLHKAIQDLIQQIATIRVQMQQNGVNPFGTQQTAGQQTNQTTTGRQQRREDPDIIDVTPTTETGGETPAPTPPPTPVTPTVVTAAQTNDAEVERIIHVLNTFRNDFLPRQARYAQATQELYEKIHALRGDVASLNSKSSQDAYTAASAKLAEVRQLHKKITDDISSDQPLAQQFANTLVRESDTLEVAHTKLKLLLEEKDENLSRDLRRGFNEVIAYVKEILDNDAKLKEKLSSQSHLLETLQTQIDSRQNDAADVARALEDAAQQVQQAAQKIEAPVKKAKKGADTVSQTATASTKRATAAVVRRTQLDTIARAYKDKRQTLLLNMELVIRQRLNLNPYNKPSAKGAEDSFKDQAARCMKKVQKTFAADKVLNMRDMASGLKKGIVEINDALGLFMQNMPEAVVSGLPQESKLLEALINDFGKLEQELVDFSKK